MRRTTALTIALAAIVSAAEARAQAPSCSSIRDSDQRDYCRGTTGSPSACSSIRDADLRERCRAAASRR